MASVTFKGVFPILVTPFDDQGNLDLESFDRTVTLYGGYRCKRRYHHWCTR